MEKKLTEEEIINYMDSSIMELVYEKVHLRKAYNYYHGIRDPEQFRHLEENFGIGTPTSVEFVPLVRKHIDVLVGEYLTIPTDPKVSCKDQKTLSNIFRDKQKAITNSVLSELKKYLNSVIAGTPVDLEVQNRIDKVAEDANKNFVSEYEIAGQNIVEYLTQARNIDFLNKRKTMLIDLLVTGTLYYKTEKSPSGTNVALRVLDPLNTFIERNSSSPYLKDSSRAVIREYLTRQQILAKYGDFLKDSDLDNLHDDSAIGEGTTYVRTIDATEGAISEGVLGGFEVSPYTLGNAQSRNFKTFPVYEVEFIKTVKEGGKYISYRYEGVRINSDIYIKLGISDTIVRSMDEPNHCALTVNGIFAADRNGDPFSLILKTANLQDKFDILNFFKDNVIAESGSVGDWVDTAFVPTFLGDNLTERLIKWKAYKKSGMALYDSSQEGNQINTAFNGYDDSIKLSTIQAIDLAIQRVEETCSTITGVFREKLNGIEQRDAVTNIQVGIRNSSFITKQYYHAMDLMTRDMLLDLLNLGKIVYKEGLTGVIILGEHLNKIFTALPEHFTLTDFDLHIADSSEVIKDQETIKGLVIELSKAGVADAEILIEVATSKSLTKMKSTVMSSINRKKEENNQLQKMEQQIQQMDQELKQTTSESQKLQNQINSLNAQKINLEKEKLEFQKQLEWYKARSKDEHDSKLVELEQKRIELEGIQLLDSNKKNDEIKDN